METTISPSLASAVQSLLQLRGDLGKLVGTIPQRMSDSMFDMCMKVRNDLASSMQLPSPTWHEVLPGKLLLKTSTLSDAFAATGQWLMEVQRRYPNMFIEPKTQPFGFNRP